MKLTWQFFSCKAEATIVANHLLAARETYLKSRLLLIFVSAAVRWHRFESRPCFDNQRWLTAALFFDDYSEIESLVSVSTDFFENFRNHKTLFFDRPEKNLFHYFVPLVHVTNLQRIKRIKGTGERERGVSEWVGSIYWKCLLPALCCM